ncbi:MAG: Rab family GTPase [Promethearchaeota archaeon]
MERVYHKASRTFKVINAGDGGVGKTTMLYRYVENKFFSDTKMTIGVGFFQKYVALDDMTISLQLWDFGGQEHFRPFLNSYMRGASAAILMFDLTKIKTLRRIDEWVDLIRKEDPECPILFVGSKLDLKDEISVQDDYALEFKEKYNFFDYVKISSKTGENVEKCFILITKKILERVEGKKS